MLVIRRRETGASAIGQFLVVGWCWALDIWRYQEGDTVPWLLWGSMKGMSCTLVIWGVYLGYLRAVPCLFGGVYPGCLGGYTMVIWGCILVIWGGCALVILGGGGRGVLWLFGRMRYLDDARVAAGRAHALPWQCAGGPRGGRMRYLGDARVAAAHVAAALVHPVVLGGVAVLPQEAALLPQAPAALERAVRLQTEATAVPLSLALIQQRWGGGGGV